MLSIFRGLSRLKRVSCQSRSRYHELGAQNNMLGRGNQTCSFPSRVSTSSSSASRSMHDNRRVCSTLRSYSTGSSKNLSSSSGSHHSTPPNASPAATHHHSSSNSAAAAGATPTSAMNNHQHGVTLTDELMAVIRRYFLLLKGRMTAKRVFSFRSNNNNNNIHSPGYGYTNTTNSNVYTYTFSDLAGHGSFLFLALSYLENDFLNLRLYAVSGISLSILFQYYREKPLWIPIRWNSIFLLINAVMIGLLWKESTDAKNLPDDQRYLYKKLFYPRGMSPVEFMHLMSIAKKKELKSNVRLVDERKQNTRVFLVVKGKLSVNKKGNKVGTIHENQFVGAMSFLTWQSKVMESRQHQKDAEEQQSFWSNNQNEETNIASPWNNEETIQGRILNLFRERKKDIDNDDIASLDDNAVAAAAPSTTTTMVLTSSAAGTVNQLQNQQQQQSSNQQPTAPSQPLHKGQQGQQGYANVISEEDCIVYYWKFNDLIHLLDEHPSLGLVFERCISDDLNRKMTSSWEEEIKTRYRQLLTGAISDGEIKDQTKSMLEKFRTTYSISSNDHEQMLRELDWTNDDFLAGFKGAPKLELIANYESLLKNELGGEFGLTDEGRESLREYRQKNGITSEIHLNTLRKFGWTLDDFEVGAKDSEVLKKRKKLSSDEHLATITSAVAKAIYAQNETIIAKQAELAIQQIQLSKQQEEAAQKQALEREKNQNSSSSRIKAFPNRPVLNWLASWFYPPSSKTTSAPHVELEQSQDVNVNLSTIEVEEEEDTASIAAALIDKEHI